MTLDLFSIGSWTIFDHLLRMQRLPNEGETLPLDMPIAELGRVHFGDCSANIAAVAARLGARTGLGMVVGDDFVTSGYAAHLAALGVDLTGTEIIPGARSGHSFNMFDAENRGFCVSHLAIAERQEGWRPPFGQVDRARALVVSEAFSPYTLAAIEHARAAGKLTAINGMVATAGADAPRFLAACDLLFLSRGESAALVAALGCGDPAGILAHGPSLVVVTGGDTGSRWFTETGETRIAAIPAARFVDSTGAGDAFVAGALVGWLQGWDIAETGSFAASVASFVVEAWGCQTNLPSFDAAEARGRAARGQEDSEHPSLKDPTP